MIGGASDGSVTSQWWANVIDISLDNMSSRGTRDVTQCYFNAGPCLRCWPSIKTLLVKYVILHGIKTPTKSADAANTWGSRFTQSWVKGDSKVCDAGQTTTKHWVNLSCLLGMRSLSNSHPTCDDYFLTNEGLISDPTLKEYQGAYSGRDWSRPLFCGIFINSSLLSQLSYYNQPFYQPYFYPRYSVNCYRNSILNT